MFEVGVQDGRDSGVLPERLVLLPLLHAALVVGDGVHLALLGQTPGGRGGQLGPGGLAQLRREPGQSGWTAETFRIEYVES